ncbi:MAG: hypothetical protein KF819_21325 [Labilithrix sp.]|nr:hypothetical protein [Labilithrix sp.]
MRERSLADAISSAFVRGSLHDDDASSAVTRWLIADREFNAWCLTEAQSADDDAIVRILDAYGEDQQRIEDAWNAFRERRELAGLLACLERSIERMGEIRETWRALGD